MVVNTIIAASVYCADNPKELKVFNAGSSYSNPVTWKAVRSLMVSYYRTHPTKRTVFTPDFFVTDNYFLYELFFTLGYRVPLTLNKIVSIATGNQKMKELSRKGDKMVDLIYKIAIQFTHFVRHSWVFTSKNTELLFTLLPEEEKKSFCFDAKKINWPLYLKSMLGIEHLCHQRQILFQTKRRTIGTSLFGKEIQIGFHRHKMGLFQLD